MGGMPRSSPLLDALGKANNNRKVDFMLQKKKNHLRPNQLIVKLRVGCCGSLGCNRHSSNSENRDYCSFGERSLKMKFLIPENSPVL